MSSEPQQKKSIIQLFREEAKKKKKNNDSVLDDRFQDVQEFADETDLERQRRIMDTPSAWT